MNIFHGFVRVSRSRWRHILDVWAWVDIFYGLVGVVEVYYGWVGADRHFYGRLGVGGSIFRAGGGG